MAEFKVAHIREQGQNVILVLVAENVEYSSREQKAQLLNALQACATAAGLAGTVALVWFHGNRLHFFGPTAWRSFLESLNTAWLLSNLNRTLTCNF